MANWFTDFDSRHRFGLPTLPIQRRGDMSPSVVDLPARAGSMKFSDEDVAQVIELLQGLPAGKAVRLTDDPDESDNTARRRTELLKEQISAKLGPDVRIRSGYKIRGHVLTAGDPTVEEKTSEKTGKTYKITSYPQNWGALSLVPEDAPEPPAAHEEPSAEPPAPATEPASAARRRG